LNVTVDEPAPPVERMDPAIAIAEAANGAPQAIASGGAEE